MTLGTHAEVRIREANGDDAAAIAGLVSQLGYPTESAAMRGRLARVAARDDCATFVAECAGSVVGVVGVQVSPGYAADAPTGRLAVLAVDAARRRGGIGGALVRWAEAWLVAWGAERVSVSSRQHRADAHAFYAALGYAENGRRMARRLDATAGPEDP